MKISPPVPILRIFDAAKAREFYVDFLGFSIDWEHRFDDNAPLYLQVSRDGCVIHLSEHHGDATPGGALRIETDEVEALNREVLQKNYRYARPGVNDTPWQTREMPITDPFGNRLIFFQPVTGAGNGAGAGFPDGMTPVGTTARWVAANRALETESVSPLYRDPFARDLAGPSGFAMMAAMRAALGVANTAAPDPYLTLRTKFLDDAVLRATSEMPAAQVLILAAGMDSRAFRLDWPEGVVLFEIDRDDVFDYKEAVLERLNASPRCDRRVVRADLAKPWTDALAGAGFDPARPVAMLIEGLLMYLDAATANGLIAALAFAADRSWMGLDVVDTQMLESPYTSNYMKKLAAAGCPWNFAVDDPEQWLDSFGWRAKAVSPGDPDANYGRWPFPVLPRSVTGVPRSYFVSAHRDPHA